MKFTKMHTGGCDYLICNESVAEVRERAKSMLNHVGADGIVMMLESGKYDAEVKLISQNGEDFCGSGAVISAAKFLYDNGMKKKVFRICFCDSVYTVRLSVMGGRIVCAWVDMPPLLTKPMEQLKYYHGIRGEVLRACIAHPRVTVYELCGEHAVFMLESCKELRTLNMQSICRRLEEVLFFGENIDLHFAAISGDNALSMRSWRCRVGEVGVFGEGAVLCAYAAAEYELVDPARVIVKSTCGNFCVELCGKHTSLCEKSETLFCGEI